MVDAPELHNYLDKDVEEAGITEVVGSDEEEPEMEAGVEGYIEKVEKAGEQAGPVPTDDSGQPLVQPSTASNAAGPDDFKLPDDAVVLPMTQQEFQTGIHEPIIRGVRWLAEWCSYIIKKLGERVFFRG